MGSHSSLKSSFTNNWGLYSNLWILSLFSFFGWDIFVLCETNTEGSIDSPKFSVRGYLPLIRRDFVTDERSCSLHVFDCPYLIFIHCWLLYSPLGTVFDDVSSNTDKALWINLSVEAFVCGNFSIHHEDWITYSVELTDQLSSI